jgi:glycosyltransferase involved in cell wall biosynthesis
VFYLSYDGIGEPLGRSQILAYLVRLAQDYEITLISYEKLDSDRYALRRELDRHGIRWRPLSYHRRPPVLSTLLDVAAGCWVLRAEARHGRPALLHVRSYVPALIALLARRVTGGRLLFDIRGFWADERVEGGIWPSDGLLYRVAKRCERWFFGRADAVVTLTDASVPQIRRWTAPRPVPIDVIPTCVDLARFGGRPERPGGPHAVWSGSIGTWYRFDLVAGLASQLGLPLTVITRQIAEAREVLSGYPADVRAVDPDNVGRELFAGDVGLCLIASTFSKVASAPTRFAEYLAAGIPVVVTPGVGDLSEIVERHGVGVVLRGEDPDSLAAAARAVLTLAGDREAHERCRSTAREFFDVDRGSARYAALYARLAGDDQRGPGVG